jgi:hypothetical protein
VDIDLKLTDENGNTVAYVYQWGSAEEAILASLEGNKDYNFTVIIWGTYGDKFCETFDIEVAVAPKSMYSGVDWATKCSQVKTPNLDDMDEALQPGTPRNYTFKDNSVFVYKYQVIIMDLYRNYTITF